MTARYDLVVAGRPSVDVMFSGLHEWPALGKDVDADGLGVCAGTSFNTPAAANRLGLRVGYVATIGNDDWSSIIRHEFETEGLPTDFLEVEDRPLPGVSVALNLDGDRGFVTHWSDGADEERLSARAVGVLSRIEARHLHGYVDEMPEVAAEARRRGMTVSLDAWGGEWWSSPRTPPELFAEVDVLFANRTEARAMTGQTDPEAALARLAEHCACVVIKCGADGAIGAAGGTVREAPGERVEVIDTTGAGDCFNAGFLVGWLGGLRLEESLALGVICGSRAVTAYGGYRACPTATELRAIASSRGIVMPSSETAPEGDGP